MRTQKERTQIRGSHFKKWCMEKKQGEKPAVIFQYVADRLQIKRKSLEQTYFDPRYLSRDTVRRILCAFPLYLNSPYVKSLGYTREAFGIYDEELVNEIHCFHFPSSNNIAKEDYNIKVKSYFSEFEKSIAQSKEKISVFDYIVTGKNKILSSEPIFLNEQKRHFAQILNHCLDNPEVKYYRTLAFPLETSLKGKEISEIMNLAIKEAIRLLFKTTIEHIWSCFDQIKDDRFKLFVCIKPIRRFTFGYMDDRVLKAHNRYNENGDVHPDMIFVYEKIKESKNKKLHEIMSVYKVDIDRLTRSSDGKNGVFHISKNIFKVCAQNLISDIKEECSELEKLIDESKSNSEQKINLFESNLKLENLKKEREIIKNKLSFLI